MSKIEELIRVKQMDIERLRREIDALKMVAPLLNDDTVTTRVSESLSGTASNEIQ